MALRSRIGTVVAAAAGGRPEKSPLAERCRLTGESELGSSFRAAAGRSGKAETGIDVLEAENFQALAGLRIGLITNQSGLDSKGRRTIDLLRKAAGVRLAAIFSPEHGLFGKADER